MRTIGILGLGIFGFTIAQTIAEYDYDVIVVDKNEEKINRLEPIIARGVVGDITDRELLEAAGIGLCDTVVISTGTVLEASVLALLHCKKLGVKRIVAKASSNVYQEVLEEMGADDIILPEQEAGIRWGKHLMRSNIEDIIELDTQTSILEFHPPKSWIGKTLQELNIRKHYYINVIGIRESTTSSLKVDVSADTVVREGILLLGITDSDIFEKLDYLKAKDE